MQSVDETRPYGIMSECLNWMMAVLVIVAWTLAAFGDDLPKVVARETGLFLHMSAGLLVLGALAMRLAWRLVDPPSPSEPKHFGEWAGGLAGPVSALAHVALYALLLAVPILGIVAQLARGDSLPLFGAIDIRSPWEGDRAFAHTVTLIHEITAHALVILVCLHAAAAVIHHIVIGDGALVRMLRRGAARSRLTHGE